MTLRRLAIAAEARVDLQWSQTAHLMAAMFWAQGHRCEVEDFLPAATRREIRKQSTDLPFPTSRHHAIERGRIKVQPE